MTYNFTDELNDNVCISRSLFEGIDKLFSAFISINPDRCEGSDGGALYTWNIDFSDKISTKKRNSEFVLSLSDDEISKISRFKVDSVLEAKEVASLIVSTSPARYTTIRYEAGESREIVVSFKNAFEEMIKAHISSEANDVSVDAPDSYESHSFQDYSAITIRPDILRRLDGLFRDSLRDKQDDKESGSEGGRRERFSWSVEFSNNREVFDKTVEEVLSFQNGEGEEIIEIRASADFARPKRIDFRFRRVGTTDGMWSVYYRGPSEELPVFRDKFDLISAAFKRKNYLVYSLFWVLFLSMAISLVFSSLLVSLFPSDVIPDYLRAPFVLGISTIAYFFIYSPVSHLIVRMYPGFECSIGDGEYRIKNQKSRRAWLAGVMASLVASGIMLAVSSWYIRSFPRDKMNDSIIESEADGVGEKPVRTLGIDQGDES